jgi:uncharacterized C2H2 Zn-finger protein
MISNQALPFAHMRRSLDVLDASYVTIGDEEATSSSFKPYDDMVDALDAEEQKGMTMAMDGQPPFKCPYCGRLFPTVYLLKYARICHQNRAKAYITKGPYQSSVYKSVLRSCRVLLDIGQ